MSKIGPLIFVLIMCFNCQSEQEIIPKEANLFCNDYLIKGQFKNDSYIFCGITQNEIQYSYNYGNWKFWDLKGKLVAEGNYTLKKRVVGSEGGCSFEIIEGKIIREDWQFWDNQGNRIPGNNKIIEQLESCTKNLNHNSPPLRKSKLFNS